MSNLEFRQQKWHRWFQIVDLNKDGILTTADWDTVAAKYTATQNLKDDEATEVKRLFYEYGEFIFGLGGKGEAGITEDKFVENITNFYTSDPVKACKLAAGIFQKLYEVADRDKDGFISEDEHVALNNAFGFDDEESRAVFKMVGPASGRKGIPIQIVRDFCMEFAFGKDEVEFNEFQKHFPTY